MTNIKLGVFETGSSDKHNSLEIIEDILKYASKAEELHFSRFWLAEHHHPNVLHAYNNPEILIAVIAGITERIRVGSAGSLIGYYSPYSLVQNYKLLNNLYNGRIDFGLSKGRPANSHKHNFFNTDNLTFENKYYLENLDKICDLLQNEVKNFEKNEIVIPPFKGEIPDLWYLSNSYKYRKSAADKGLNICRSLMHGLDVLNLNPDKENLLEFKNDFYSRHGRNPDVAAAIAVSFSKSQQELDEKDKSVVSRNESIKTLAIEPTSLKDKLLELQMVYGIDEFIIYDVEKNIDKKMNNLLILSEIMELVNIEEINA